MEPLLLFLEEADFLTLAIKQLQVQSLEVAQLVDHLIVTLNYQELLLPLVSSQLVVYLEEIKILLE